MLTTKLKMFRKYNKSIKTWTKETTEKALTLKDPNKYGFLNKKNYSCEYA